MGLPYHFVDLDDAQQARRRELLDSYGHLAQLSAIIFPLLLFQFFFLARFIVRKLQASRNGRLGKARQSPQLASFADSPKPAAVLWRRIRWEMNEQIIQGWGTRAEWMIAGLWTMWLLLLVVRDTGDDYLHVTKRFGIVAASQLPLHYLLVLKSWSPIQYLTRFSHEELNPYHRWLGRILITFFAIHATLYLNFYIQLGLLSKRIRDRDVILGLSGISTFMIIGTTALAAIRNYSYRLFFIIHVLLSITILPTLYFHVSHLRIYILESAAIYALLVIQRNFSSTQTPAILTHLPKTNLLSISIPLTSKLAQRFQTPGQHIYLSLPASPTSPLNKLRLNPFTIANLPSQENHLRVVIRCLAGTTKLLSTLAHSSKKASIPLQIEGPYGSAPYFPNLLEQYDCILLIAGGVGATFTLPIYRHLLQRLRTTDDAPAKIRFVWSVRDAADAAWGTQQLADDGETDPPGYEVFISGSSTQHAPQQRPPQRRQQQAQGESIELEERAQLLDGEEDEEERINSSAPLPSHRPRRGRPPLGSIVDETFAHNPRDRVAVLVCGPQGLGATVRKEVGRWVAKGREVFWHAEEFGW